MESENHTCHGSDIVTIKGGAWVSDGVARSVEHSYILDPDLSPDLAAYISQTVTFNTIAIQYNYYEANIF